jgi:hypothetical protein
MAIQSGFYDIDENGNTSGTTVDLPRAATIQYKEERPSLKSYVSTLQPGMFGCAMAYHPKLFSIFGPVPEALVHEDNVVALRALLLGPLVFTYIPLLKRRIHGTNIFSRRHEVVTTAAAVMQQEARMTRDARSRAGMYEAFRADLKVAHAKGMISEEQAQDLETECLRFQRLFSYQRDFGNANVVRKLRILMASRRDDLGGHVVKWMLPRLLPGALFRSLKVAGNSLRLALRPTRRITP